MTYKIIIIVIAVLGSAFSLVLEYVKYRSAENPTPKELSDVYDVSTYERWKKYSSEHSVLNLISTAAISVISIILLVTNVYAAFASIFDNVIWDLYSVVILETAVGAVVGFVKKYFETMVIEQKYGFNRTSVKTFIFDGIKMTFGQFGLSVFLVAIIFLFHSGLGDWMIIPVIVALYVLILVVNLLYPVMRRLGNKFTPLEDGELKDRLTLLLERHNYKVKDIEVMDASKRTSKLNAYFTGAGKSKRIVLYDNLVNSMSTDEICAVFAHELGHGLNKDVTIRKLLSLCNFTLLAVVAWAMVRDPELYVQFGFEKINYGFTFVVLGIVLGLLQPLLGMFINWVCRKQELLADSQAVKEGYGVSLVSGLKKLAKENFAHLSPSRMNVVLEYSHPPLADRISAVEKALAEMECSENKEKSK